MKINKVIFKVFLPMLALVLILGSCQKNDDLTTADAKTGGLVVPSGSIPYKLGVTPTFDIEVGIPQGPSIKTITVSYYYMRSSDGVKSNTKSFDMDVAGANATADITKKLAYTWTKLREGIVLPSDPQIPLTDLDPTISGFIGDYWMFSYVSTMDDGRKVVNNNTTKISVANFFAGTYDVEILYFHPTAGGSYPTEAYGGVRKLKLDLIPESPFTCYTWFAIWQDNYIHINIDASNKVTLTFDRTDGVSGDPLNAANVNTYNPATGVIQIYYHYVGGSGPRIFWEKFTPKK